MSLASLLKVAQGKSAAEVSFTDSFLNEYNKVVARKDERDRQPIPKDYFRPSSMYGCERMLFFMRVHCKGKASTERDACLVEICQSGTDRHLDIQHIVEDMEGVTCLDIEEVVKEANQKGINTEFVGWNEDHTEARCKNDELSIYFQPDGVIHFKDKDVILEIKTESTYQHKMRYEPKEDHKYQATCYGMGLGIDYVLFLYEDRNFCSKKAYLWKITDEMKAKVKNKIDVVNACIKMGVPPSKNEDKCTYCDYKNECKLADEGKWVDPRPKEQPAKKRARKKTTGKKKTTKAKTATTAQINKAIDKQEAAYQAKIEHEADMEAIDARRDW